MNANIMSHSTHNTAIEREREAAECRRHDYDGRDGKSRISCLRCSLCGSQLFSALQNMQKQVRTDDKEFSSVDKTKQLFTETEEKNTRARVTHFSTQTRRETRAHCVLKWKPSNKSGKNLTAKAAREIIWHTLDKQIASSESGCVWIWAMPMC